MRRHGMLLAFGPGEQLRSHSQAQLKGCHCFRTLPQFMACGNREIRASEFRFREREQE